MISLRLLFCASAILLHCAHSIGATDHDRSDPAVDQSFERFVEETRLSFDVPGAVVVVVNSKGVMSIKGYGVRERGNLAPVDGDTRFQIASMSKFLAATAVGTIVDRGIVSWDQSVREFSPETILSIPYATENATLRDYFAHRTGLPAYAGDFLTGLDLTAAELVLRARHLPFDHSFRSEMAYSNYGIFLGQQAAATAAGLTPSTLLLSAIFKPLAMARSGPGRSTLFEDDNRAAGHDRDGTVMAYEDVDAFSGAGAIVSTGADIARWMQMLLAQGVFDGRRVLASATVAQIMAPSMVEGPSGPLRDKNAAAGLGCDSYHFLRYRIIEKNGALNGVRTIVTLIPDLKVGIAVLANKQLTVFPEAVRAEFLERQVGRSGLDLQEQIRSEQFAWNALLDIPKPPSDAAPAAHPLEAYAGTYENAFYGPLHIRRDGNDLAITLAGKPGMLKHWSVDTFLLNFPNPDTSPGLLTFSFDTDVEHATRIEGRSLPGAFSVNYGTFVRKP
ncbi:D-aminopeptidase [Methylobacterium crusticola]|uniref:D-aminopeptidase n=1 Tax=Methylobacterium crusticola TaxID=1697972 RepID=A0ABQ4R029_9HYPH|nr:serine hydrolase [Methylobacterium crusticola]GJD50514.1 D-aminopeptidase [Methylobacterium crusticola]